MTELLELSINDDPPNRLFLEYERHLTRTIAEAFGIPARKPIDFRAKIYELTMPSGWSSPN